MCAQLRSILSKKWVSHGPGHDVDVAMDRQSAGGGLVGNWPGIQQVQPQEHQGVVGELVWIHTFFAGIQYNIHDG